MVEIAAVLFVIGMMLVLYLDFIGRNNGTKQFINVDARKKQEDRLTFNEKRIVYKYILKDCLLNQFRTVLPKHLQRLFFIGHISAGNEIVDRPLIFAQSDHKYADNSRNAQGYNINKGGDDKTHQCGPKSNFFTVHFCDSNSNDPLADSISIPNDRNN